MSEKYIFKNASDIVNFYDEEKKLYVECERLKQVKKVMEELLDYRVESYASLKKQLQQIIDAKDISDMCSLDKIADFIEEVLDFNNYLEGETSCVLSDEFFKEKIKRLEQAIANGDRAEMLSEISEFEKLKEKIEMYREECQHLINKIIAIEDAYHESRMILIYACRATSLSYIQEEAQKAMDVFKAVIEEEQEAEVEKVEC